jgi:hypothetical protein
MTRIGAITIKQPADNGNPRCILTFVRENDEGYTLAEFKGARSVFKRVDGPEYVRRVGIRYERV